MQKGIFNILSGTRFVMVLMISLGGISSGAYAQTFNNVTGSVFPFTPDGLSEANLKWGDLDNDGDLDLIVTGARTFSDFKTVKYINNGTQLIETFNNPVLPEFKSSALELGDYDGDGDLDLFIAGQSQVDGDIARFYKNDGNGDFSFDNTASANFTNQDIENPSGEFGDFDNDGDLDLLFTGLVNGVVQIRLLQNNGFSQFQGLDATITNLTDITEGNTAWGDYDKDGDLDVLLAGEGNGGIPTTRLFENTGNGIFANITTSLTNVKNGSIAWEDFDNDGDLDVLLAGSTNSSGTTRATKVFRNDNGAFIDISAGLTDITFGRAIWVDYNLDGWSDIILSGQDGTTTGDRTTEVYLNDQNGGFTLQVGASANLVDLNNGVGIAAGDYNGDNKPDLIISGSTFSTVTHTMRLYENVGAFTNDIPPVPQTPIATQVGTEVQFTWNLNGVTYPSNLQPGLSYNLFIGTATAKDSIDPGLADLNTGYRRIVKMGLTKGQSWVLDGLPAGDYVWGVQSVDSDFEGSAFGIGNSFTVTSTTSNNAVFVDQTGPAFAVPGLNLVSHAAIEWGDLDNDGDQDFAVAGRLGVGGGTEDTRIYENLGNGTFGEFSFSSQVVDIAFGDIAFGDIDNDNDLDIVICGLDDSNNRVLNVYRNDLTGIAYWGITSTLDSVSKGSLDFGDYDNDGDLDLLVTGLSKSGNTIARIYRNKLNPLGVVGFEVDLASDAVLQAVEAGDAKFGDYNNDGHLDIILTGLINTGNFTEVYKNTGNATYTPLNSNIPSLDQSSVDWGDIDNDGDLDIVVSGFDNSVGSQAFTAVFKYIEIGQFLAGFFDITSTSSAPITDVAYGSVAFGDYNDDGFLDLLATGQTGPGSSAQSTKVYQNNGSTTNPKFFEDLSSSSVLTDVDEGSQAFWVDYDGDKKLDIALVGRINGGSKSMKLFENIDANLNNTPDPPTNLQASLNGFSVDLSWDPPASHPANSINGLTYSLYIDTLGGASNVDILSPMANLTNGYRRTNRHGGVFLTNEITINDLAPGTYTWSVQTVDQDFEGSAFATSGTFTFEEPSFILKTADIFPFTTPKGLRDADVAWGDYTGTGGQAKDGYLDIVAIGSTNSSTFSSTLYEYDTNSNIFVEDNISSSQITNVHSGSVDWGDYDNDGDQDLLLTGMSAGGPITHIYQNLGGDFSSVLVTSITGVSHGFAKFGDYDNDGWLDIMLSGDASGTSMTEIYRNTYASTPSTPFTPSGVTLQALKNSSGDWGDFNNDGYLDFILMGELDNGNSFTRIYVNDQNGGLNIYNISGLIQVESGDVAWGDYNADGFLDFGITGVLTNANSNGNFQGRVYRSNGGVSFTNIGAPIPGGYQGSLSWGDYNNDGFKDLIVTGQGNSTGDRFARFFEYIDSNNNFGEDTVVAAPFLAVNGGSDAAWGDYDQDGKLDLLIVGQNADLPVSGSFNVFQNIETSPATTPNPPTALKDTIIGYETILSWTPPVNITENKGLSYNVYVGTTPMGFDQRSPNALISDGSRQIVQMGQVNDTTKFRLKNLTQGTYYWGVQAIDADFEPSTFATGNSFTYELPTFVDVSPQRLPGNSLDYDLVAMAWGDYDGDDDLDLMVSGGTTGNNSANIYRNNGAGAFTNISSGLLDLSDGSIEWGDIDNDNDLDLLQTGQNNANSPRTRIYENNNGSLTVSTTTLPNVKGGQATFGDYDYDGDQDILIAGNDGANNIAQILRNDAGSFTDINAGLTGINQGTADWFDYNLDGFLDVLISGNTGSNKIIHLYENDGNQGFTNISSGLIAIDSSSIDINDYNNDGYPDVLLTGVTGNGVRVSRVYRNNFGTGGTFQLEAGASMTGVSNGDAKWIDYNNDGWLDIVLVGQSDNGPISEVYQNDGTGSFTKKEVAAFPILGLGEGAALAVGDFNNDHKLDLAAAGKSSGSTWEFQILQNVDTFSNTTLNKPETLNRTISGDTVIFSWAPPAGSAVPVSNGFSYNLYIGSSPGMTDLQSPMSNVGGSPFRKVVATGNTGQNLTWKVHGLDPGLYYWSVQAIDQDFEPSVFAPEDTFTFAPPAFVNVNALTLNNPGFDGVSKGKVLWVDYDNDQDLDVFVTGETGTSAAITGFLENNNNTFSPDPLATGDLANLIYSRADFGDYDNDGDLDLALAGELPHSGNPGTGTAKLLIYKNIGQGRFLVDNNTANLDDYKLADLKWGDYDNDGDLDLLISGRNSSGASSEVFRNDDSVFVSDPLVDLQPAENGSVDWGDFDKDGDLDILLTGHNGNNLYSHVYRNNGVKQGFTKMSALDAPLTPVKEGCAVWGDYNQDGFLDILLVGESTPSTFSPQAQVLYYDDDSRSFLEDGIVLEGVKLGHAGWGDINDDGWLDIVISGKNGPNLADRTTRIYLNDQLGDFTPDGPSNNHIKGVDEGSSAAFGDYDEDGKLDLAIIGRAADAAPRRTLTIYRNIEPTPNHVPVPPTLMQPIVSGDSVVLPWTAPGNSASYSYNVYLGTVTKTDDEFASMAQIDGPDDGFRRIVKMGNVGHGTEWSVRNLPAGTYFWAVQSIDADFEGSGFSAENSFIYTPPHYVDVGSIVFNDDPEAIDVGTVSWGDYDDDNDLDFIAAGEDANGDPITQLFKNDAGRFFDLDQAYGANLPNVKNGKFAWADYDLDGKIDIAIVGEDENGPVAEVFRNGTNSFIAANINLDAVTNSVAAWADVDNDGDPDLLISGENSGGTLIAKIYENRGVNNFQELAALNGHRNGDADFIDYNKDGFIDVILAGDDGSGASMELYNNNGDGTFTVNSIAFAGDPGYDFSSAEWGDFNNDGLSDLLVSGTNTNGNPETEIYQNQGDSTFQAINAGITAVSNGQAVWGDYDNDGWSDVLITGEETPAQDLTAIFKNDGMGGFANIADASDPLIDAGNGSRVAFGDYNGDQKLDILAIGRAGNNPVQDKFLTIYRNDEQTPNTSPDAPSMLSQEIVGSKLRLSWDVPTNGDPDIIAGYSYNLIMGTGHGMPDIISPMANSDTANADFGFRKVVQLGNGSQSFDWDIQGLEEGQTLFWSVQAIDQDFEGSEFVKPFVSLEFNPPSFDNQTPNLFPNNQPDGITESDIALGDYDNDGDLDILSAGDLGGGLTSTTLYINNGGLTFDEDVDVPQTVSQVRLSSLVWMDYDNDNDLDILLSGQEADNALVTHIYENKEGVFELDVTASAELEDVFKGSNDIADYDNDGDQDILLTGSDINGDPVIRLYRNDGESQFTDVTDVITDAVGVAAGSVAWGDYDRDGFFDFIITGETPTGAVTKVYHNDGEGNFADAGFTDLQAVKNSTAAWADYDNDSYLDLLITGESASTNFEAFTRVYRYDPVLGKFDKNESAIEDISRGSAIWGDFDNDGWVDILISGKDGPGDEDRTTRLYRNDRNTQNITFNEDVLSSADLEDVDLGATVFGDYDGDQKIDIILTGRTSTSPVERSFAIFQNIDTTINPVLNAPADPISDIFGTDVTLSWSPPPGHDINSRLGLTYNVVIGLVGDTTFHTSPMSQLDGNDDGYRRLVRWGNMGTGTSKTFAGFPDGTYYWRVQAVDQDFEGSPFSVTDTFDFQNPIPEIVESSFAEIYNTGEDTLSYIRVATDTVIDQVIVRYKGIAEELWKEVTIPSDNNTYTFNITSSEVDEMGVEYFFEIQGTFGFNLSTDTLYTYRRYPDGFDFNNLDFGKEVINYNLLSVPLVLDNKNISSILDPVLGEYDIFKWRFWHYQNGAHVEYQSGITTIDDGKGYWLITKEEASFNSGGGVVVESNDSHPYIISLNQGWNQIGNPYPYNLAWQDILDANPGADAELDDLLLFNRGYQNGSVINQQRGAFVFANTAMTLDIPVRKNLSVQRITRVDNFTPVATYLQRGTWSLDIMLKSGKVTYPLGGIGMHPSAKGSKDQFDAITAPRLSEYLEINFEHPEYFAPHFSRDIVPSAKNHVWEFTVNSNLETREIELDWDYGDLRFAGQQLILFDVERQKAINMEEHSQYVSISDQKERKFRIYYGSQDFITEQLKPDFVHLGLAYPNPSAGEVHIPFALPSSITDYQVSVAIYTLSGQKVRQLTTEFYREGFHEITWDGRNSDGQKLSKGVYLYQLKVIENGKASQQTGRIMIE